MVKPLVKVLTPERVNNEVALFWITPVTLVPMTELIDTPAVLLLELVTVPTLLIAPVESAMLPPPIALLISKLLLPVTPPVRLKV